MARTKFPSISATAQGIVSGCATFPGANVCLSTWNDYHAALASEHARYMASVMVQGHQHFQERFNKLLAAGFGKATEICAQSWPWQADLPMWDLGYEMFHCWQQSSGHWATASTTHKWWGCDMQQGRNGVWYACILVSDP